MKTTKFEFENSIIDSPEKRKNDLARWNWAKKTFGKPGMTKRWFCRTYISKTHHYGKNLVHKDLREVFYFKNAKDATLFALRWSR